ncbi:hypothetical protein D1007_25378 [Hordeum vulgare]|nr:hypothetical protein D1007_25378 [Hordeum vulgare]
MGLPDAMQWWDEWKLRVLVLCSLSVQFFLHFSDYVRTVHRLRKLRVLVWMAHIGGDALAVYALAVLFNRQKQIPVDEGSDALELIWVPILLIHLGGQISISAYSLEDNELWMRHAITLVSQVAVALYIFCKWWSGQKKLLLAAVFLFVVGILKFSQKPWALRSASFNSMASRTSLVLFAKSDKDGYNEKDIWVSYVLFSSAVVIQFPPILPMPQGLKLATWQDMVSQHNLMSFCARENQPDTLMKIVAFKCPMEYINKHCYNWQETVALQIQVLIRHYIKDGWKEYINDPTTYRRFNNFRGQRTLSRHPQHLWSLELGFDEIVLVWHIATDLCFHHPAATSSQGPSGDIILRSRQISNYMIYLLFMRPEMLMAGTRQDLFTVACDDIKDILKDQNDPASIAQEILLMEHGEVKGAVLPNAHRLAEELMAHTDEEQRWEVIQGVWVEMLCYSASRCRGYLHAKSLGEGGEFLTNVWFLWSLMGMEILGDKIHQPLEEEGITCAPV